METEIFDIYSKAGELIGQASRRDAHRYGYWHQTFHCWIYEIKDEIPYLIFQQRHASKDTYPLYFDITAAGHLHSGEKVEHAVREIEEELGLQVAFEELAPIGIVKYESEGVANGEPFIDREISHLFALQNKLPLAQWTLQSDEVIGIYFISLHSLKQLVEQQVEAVQVSGYQLLDTGALAPYQLQVKEEQFVPHGRSYYLHVIQSIEKLATHK